MCRNIKYSPLEFSLPLLYDFQGCPETSNEAQCSLACIMTAPPNDKFDAVMECMAENDCIAQYPQDGQCLASDDEALQSITDIAQLQG